MEYVGLTEEEFNKFIDPMVIPPHKANFKNNNISNKLWDFDQWYRENNLRKKMIGVINFGLGNLGSVINSFNEIKAEVKIISNPKEIDNFDRIILPGVALLDSEWRIY